MFKKWIWIIIAKAWQNIYSETCDLLVNFMLLIKYLNPC